MISKLSLNNLHRESFRLLSVALICAMVIIVRDGGANHK